jgi:hypothetical protein
MTTMLETNERRADMTDDIIAPEIKNLPHGFTAIFLSHNDIVELWKNENTEEDQNGEK